MNRAERRRLQREGYKAEKEAVLRVKASDVEKAIQNRLHEQMPSVTDDALTIMLYNSIMVLEGHLEELREIEDMKDAIQMYARMLQFQVECFAERRISWKDMRTYLKDEYDIEMHLK